MANDIKRKWWRVFLVEKGFQRRQLIRLLGLASISIFLSALVMYLFYNEVIDALTSSDLPMLLMPEETEALAESIPNLRETLFVWMGVLAILNVLLVLCVGGVITSRLGGPLYRFKQVMRQIAEGDLTVDVRVRKQDEFKELAENISDAIARLQLMVMAIGDNVTQLRELEDRPEKLSDLPLITEQIESALSYFQTIEIPQENGQGNTLRAAAEE